MNIFEKLDKWQKEKLDKKIGWSGVKARKNNIIDSSIFLMKTNRNKENANKQSPNSTLITALTTVGNKISKSKICINSKISSLRRLNASDSHEDSLDKEKIKRSINEPPKYKINYTGN